MQSPRGLSTESLTCHERLERLAHELTPKCQVSFDDFVPNYISMRVHDGETGALLLLSAGDYHTSEIAKKDDEEVKRLLKTWSNGNL